MTRSVLFLAALGCAPAPSSHLRTAGWVDGSEPTLSEVIWYGLEVGEDGGEALANYTLIFTSEPDACERLTGAAFDGDPSATTDEWRLQLDTFVSLDAVGDLTLSHARPAGAPLTFAASLTQSAPDAPARTWSSVGGQVDYDAPAFAGDLLNGASLVTLGTSDGGRADLVLSYRAEHCPELAEALLLTVE